MKNLLFTLTIFIAMLLGNSVFAEGTANVFIVHGIPGNDLGLNKALPVDISVDGSCAITNFKFGDIAGPVELPAGKRTIAISLRDKVNPCGGTVAIGPANIKFSEGENATIIAYLKNNGTPSARKYTNDTSSALGGRARVAIHHTANAAAVDVAISDKLFLNRFRNGEKFAAEIPNGEQSVTLYAAGTDTAAFGPVTLDLDKKTGYLIYAVGTVESGTFTVLLIAY